VWGQIQNLRDHDSVQIATGDRHLLNSQTQPTEYLSELGGVPINAGRKLA